jgi:hypothetical protein
MLACPSMPKNAGTVLDSEFKLVRYMKRESADFLTFVLDVVLELLLLR